MIILKDIMHTEPLPHDFTCESHLCTAHYNYTFPGSIFCGFQRCGPVAKHCASSPFRFHPRARTNPCVLAHTRAALPGAASIQREWEIRWFTPSRPPQFAVGGRNRRRATARCCPPAPPERSSGRESAGQFHKKLLLGLPYSWGGARQWERSADDWPGDPPAGRRTVECNAWIPAAWLGNSIPIIMPAWGFSFSMGRIRLWDPINTTQTNYTLYYTLPVHGVLPALQH